MFDRVLFRRAALAGLLLGAAGCASFPEGMPPTADIPEAPVVRGPSVRRNHTPLEPAFGCLSQGMRRLAQPVFGVGVGDIKDYTGKYSTLEGNTITQGGALMIYSALGKLGDAIQLQERFDTRIAELELAYADRRQLGDGRTYTIDPGKPAVPWVPYFGGSIMRSSYYIVGGITELNYNIDSGGVELMLSGIGGKRRTFTMNIGVDLRIVDTRSLIVARTVSLQKQIIGKEVGAGIYRFFGNELLDVNVGNKSQEPLQLGVRTTIEHGVIELIAAVAGLDPTPCLAGSPDASGVVAPPLPKPAAALPAAVNGARMAGGPVSGGQSNGGTANGGTSNGGTSNGGQANGGSLAQRPTTILSMAGDGRAPNPNGARAAPVTTGPGLVPQNSAAGTTGGTQQVPFEVGSSVLLGQAASAVDQTVAEVAKGAVTMLHLLARDNEDLPPAKRRELAEQRVRVVTDALAARGIDPARVRIEWLPSSTEAAITRHSPGYQVVARLRVVR